VSDGTTALAPSPAILLWNAGARTLILMFIVVIVTRMRDASLDLGRAADRERDVAERLKAADRLKNTLLNAVSHELRTPVASILGSARTLELLDASLTASERCELLAAVSRNAGKLDRLVRDLLDVDRMSQDPGALDRTDVDMDPPNQARVRVVGEPVPAHVDGPKVERILENLVENGIKYAPAPSTIRVVVTAQDGVPTLIVEDSGPGVDPAAREAIFEPFRRGESSAGSPGVGIGLSLVRAFATLHGGDAWVEERPGGGARFVVTLPADVPAPGQSERRPGPSLSLGTPGHQIPVAAGA